MSRPRVVAETPGPEVPGDAVDDGAEEMALALLEELVRVPSPTGATAEASLALMRWGQSQGLHAGLTPTGAPWISTAENPFAADLPRPHILLYGHLDTVPGEIPVRIESTNEGDVLWGRGTVDAKGPLATFAAVVAALADGYDAGTLTVIGANDEEGDSDTAFWTIGAMEGHPPDLVVIGEPSGALACTLGYKGRILLDVSITRDVVHGGYPEPSAPDRLVAALQRFREAIGDERPLDEAREGLFGRTSSKIRSFAIDSDGLSDTARARIDVRIPPGTEPEDIADLLRDDPVAPKVHVADALLAYVAPRNTPLVRAFCNAIRAEGERPTLLRKTGTSDLNILARAWPDAQFATYGPGDAHLDHTPEERIRLDEVRQGVRVLRRVLGSRLQ